MLRQWANETNSQVIIENNKMKLFENRSLILFQMRWRGDWNLVPVAGVVDRSRGY